MYFYFKMSNFSKKEELYLEIKQSHKKVISNFQKLLTPDKNNTLQVDDIINNIFPTDMDFKVFISHSHEDLAKANALANILYRQYNIISFIDSQFWGDKLDLQKEIDKFFCYRTSSKTYDYDKRNVTTTHVNIILAHALKEMMDRCDCVIFLSTPNSINIQNDIKNQSTYSPWIFYELSTLKTLRKHNKPEIERMSASTHNTIFESKALLLPDLKYNINTDMPDITINDLEKYTELWSLCEYIDNNNK